MSQCGGKREGRGLIKSLNEEAINAPAVQETTENQVNFE